MKLIKIIFAFSFFSFASPSWSGDAFESSQEVKEYIDQLNSKGVSDDFNLSPDLKKRIEKINKTVSSDEWKRGVTGYLGSIQKIKSENITPLNPAEQSINPINNLSGKVVIFISSSVPLKTLRVYARDLSEQGGVMVLRGGIGGIKKIQPTLSFIRSILSKDPSCITNDCEVFNTEVLIDPKLFTHYSVNRVPALAFTKQDIFSSYCERQDTNQITTSNHVVYGDASINELLQSLYEKTKDSYLKKYMDELSNDR